MSCMAPGVLWCIVVLGDFTALHDVDQVMHCSLSNFSFERCFFFMICVAFFAEVDGNHRSLEMTAPALLSFLLILLPASFSQRAVLHAVRGTRAPGSTLQLAEKGCPYVELHPVSVVVCISSLLTQLGILK